MAGGDVVGVQCFGIGDGFVAGAADFLPVTVFGADAGIIEPGRDRVHGRRLAVLVLQHVAIASVEHARLALRKAGGVLACLRSSAAGLCPHERDVSVVSERAKIPAAFEPPPTQATTMSGRRPTCSRHWALVSRPITDWKSRTIIGNGCGPTTLPIV